MFVRIKLYQAQSSPGQIVYELSIVSDSSRRCQCTILIGYFLNTSGLLSAWSSVRGYGYYGDNTQQRGRELMMCCKFLNRACSPVLRH